MRAQQLQTHGAWQQRLDGRLRQRLFRQGPRQLKDCLGKGLRQGTLQRVYLSSRTQAPQVQHQQQD